MLETKVTTGTGTTSDIRRDTAETTSRTKPSLAARIMEKTSDVAAKIGDAAYNLAHKADARAEKMEQKSTGTLGTTSASKNTQTYVAAPSTTSETDRGLNAGQSYTSTTMGSSGYQEPYTSSSTTEYQEPYQSSTLQSSEQQQPYSSTQQSYTSTELYQQPSTSSSSSFQGDKTTEDPLASKLDTLRINQQS
jgi:hypothetical protein